VDFLQFLDFFLLILCLWIILQICKWILALCSKSQKLLIIMWFDVLLLGMNQMSKDIPDLLRMKSTDYDPSPSQVCVNVDNIRINSISLVGLIFN